MKNVQLLIFVFLSLFFVANINATESKTRADIDRELEMEGELASAEVRSISFIKSIRVNQYSKELVAVIGRDFGTLNITIKKNGKTVFQTTINTRVQRTWKINTEILGKGYYIIEFKDSKNRRLTGNFTL